MSVAHRTVANVVSSFVERQRARCAPSTLATYARMTRLIVRLHGDRDATGITAADLDAFRAARKAEGVADGTLDLDVAFYRRALEAAGVGPGPDELPRLRARHAPPKYVEPDDVQRLVDACSVTDRFRRMAPFVQLAAFAGLRGGEIAWLRWVDVDLHRMEVHVRPWGPIRDPAARRRDGQALPESQRRLFAWQPKTQHSTRLVPIDEELRDWLVTWRLWLERIGTPMPKPIWLVAPFFSTGTRRELGHPWERTALLEQARALFRFAGVHLDGDARHRLHALRGTYATNLLRNGVDIGTVRDLMGHSNVAVTSAYAYSDSHTKRAAVTRLRAKFPTREELSREAFAAAGEEL